MQFLKDCLDLGLCIRTPTPTNKNYKPTHNFLLPNNDDGFEDFEPPVFEINPKNVIKHGEEEEEEKGPKNQQKSPKITPNHLKSPKSKPNKKVELSDEDFEDSFDEIITSDDEGSDFEVKPKRKSPAKKPQNSRQRSRKSYQNLDGHFSGYSSESSDEENNETHENIIQRYSVKI